MTCWNLVVYTFAVIGLWFVYIGIGAGALIVLIRISNEEPQGALQTAFVVLAWPVVMLATVIYLAGRKIAGLVWKR